MTLTPEQVLAKALHQIVAVRDGIAVGTCDMPDGYECFDDWAADLAEKALDEAGHYHSWHTRDTTTEDGQ